jgi:hypothetical protein
MTTLSMQSVVTRGADHVETEIGGQVFMMRIAEGKYYALDSTARRIWQLLVQPVCLDDVAKTLIDEYEVEPAQCRREVLALAEGLLLNGLIVTAD